MFLPVGAVDVLPEPGHVLTQYRAYDSMFLPLGAGDVLPKHGHVHATTEACLTWLQTTCRCKDWKQVVSLVLFM